MSDRTIQAISAEEEVRMAHLAEVAEQDRSAVVEQLRRIENAAAESSFWGTVRRALLMTDVPLSDLLAVAGITLHELDEFRCGEKDLSFEAFERLAERLGFTLVRTPVTAGGG